MLCRVLEVASKVSACFESRCMASAELPRIPFGGVGKSKEDPNLSQSAVVFLTSTSYEQRTISSV